MRVLLTLVLIMTGTAAAATPLGNLLVDHPSPYLAMHGNDPVAWQTWDAASFERARNTHKPIFVSSGYFSCHWCHVMQRETYHDAAIAAYINQYFIPIKIDRELLPDVDADLIDFAKRTRGQAGWPLNVFLTPDGYPLVAALYLPPQQFHTLLTNIQSRWAAEADTLTRLARERVETLTTVTAELTATPEAELSSRFVQQALAMADEFAGGFGTQSKFPMAPQLWALFDAYDRQSDPRLAKFLRLTLEQMAGQGLYDHLGGGFFRYSVEPAWQTPHFEKMLYDNAQLVRVYLRAARVFNEPAFADIARTTLDFVLDTMQAPDGGFYAALSAVDGNGIEGGYYLWDTAEIEQLSGVDWPVLRDYWGLQENAAFEAGHLLIPRQSIEQTAATFKLSAEEIRARLALVRKKLLERRNQRRVPIDTKVLAGWNGLLLTSLVEAARQLESTVHTGRYTAAAHALRAFIRRQFVVQGHLVRMRSDAAPVPASLEDYAYVIEGLQAWQTAFGQGDDALLRKLRDTAWAQFYVDQYWYQGSDALLRWRGGEATIPDGATPSPAAVLLRITPHRTEPAATALRRARPVVMWQLFEHAGYVSLYDGMSARPQTR